MWQLDYRFKIDFQNWLCIVVVKIHIQHPIYLFQEAKCAYVILLMLAYYLTEVIPIAIVALTPLILLPLFEIIPPKVLSQLYMRVKHSYLFTFWSFEPLTEAMLPGSIQYISYVPCIFGFCLDRF